MAPDHVVETCLVVDRAALHDDVIDNSNLRRGNPTVNSRWGNHISILIGDYLYSKAMSLALNDKDHLVMEAVASVTMEMAKGQVIETLKQRDLGISEEDYYRIIALKTASLFEASCTIGALLGGVSPQQRAQITASDLAAAFAGEGPGAFHDLDRLTMFADNLVPHVLRLAGVLEYAPELLERIEREERLEAGAPEEVEIRACGLEAVERMVAVARAAGHDVNARHLDTVLWTRGQDPTCKAHPRHRARSPFY